MGEQPTAGWLHALALDGQGGARAIAPPVDEPLRLASSEQAWLHLDRSDEQAQRWLRRHSGLSAFACEVLLEENTRPRSLVLPEGGLLLFLRGVNLNPGAEPEDMVSLRVYVDERRLYSLRLRPSQVADELAGGLSAGQGARSLSELLLALAAALTARVEEVIFDLNELVGDEEELVDEDEAYAPDQRRIAALRRRSAGLRRFLLPQREIFAQLARLQLAWLSPADLAQWNELHNRLIRHLEELELIRERVGMLLELGQRRLSERMGRVMYLLTIITVFFMPLSFFTGLLGINVGGIPGADHSYGFAIVCTLLAVVAIGQWLLLRHLRTTRM